MATGDLRAEPFPSEVRSKPFGKKRVSTEGTLRGRGPGTYTGIAEITPGRAIFQQGLVATCKDLPVQANPSRQEERGLAHEPVRAMNVG